MGDLAVSRQFADTRRRLESIAGRAPKHGPRFRGFASGPAGVYEELWDTLLNKGSSWTGRTASRRKDGTRYEELVTISPVRTASGEIVDYIMIERDVTAESAVEEISLEAARRNLLRAAAEAADSTAVGMGPLSVRARA